MTGLKGRIKENQLKAAISANSELILLYWDIGREILERQGKEGWGAKIVERLSADLKQEFPGMKGSSPRNLKYMRAFAQNYPQREFVQEVLAEYSLRDINKPIGVSEYQLTQAVPEVLKSSLPSIEELESELEQYLNLKSSRKGSSQH